MLQHFKILSFAGLPRSIDKSWDDKIDLHMATLYCGLMFVFK